MGRTDKEIYRVIDNVNSYYRINSESKKELLLNKYPNAAAAYSLRLLDGYYRGPLVRVRRDDGVEVDVYPDYNNQLSLDSLVTNVPVHTTNDGIEDEDYTFQLSLSSLGEFVGATGYSSTVSATDATVCVWYDQSSTDGVANDNDASQNVADNQPLIVSGGVIVTESGKPQIDFDGTSSRLNTTISAISQPFTSFQVVKGDVLGTVAFIYSATSSAVSLLYTELNLIRINAGVSLNSSAIRDTNQTLLSAVFNGASSATYKNGSSVASGNAGTTSLSNLIIGSPSFANQRFDGKIQELVVYPSNQSTNRTDIEEDINSFYQIDGYTPTPKLIDLTQALAVENGDTIADGTPAAAYSLRLLSSTYNGPLVRIIRTIDNTEVDVYPDSDGEFSIYSTIKDGGTELTTGVTGGSTDKTTLHEFLYGQDTDCMVVRWYDQASGNHATQDVATNQPKIYDSATGVVTDNGRSAAFFDGDYLNTAALSATGQATNFAVAHVDGGTGNRVMFFTPEIFAFRRLVDFAFFTQGAQVAYATSNLDDQNLHYFGADASQSFGAINGATITTSAVSADSQSKIAIGTQSNNGIPFYGYIQECIYYNSDQSTNRTAIETNINQHYNIY